MRNSVVSVTITVHNFTGSQSQA